MCKKVTAKDIMKKNIIKKDTLQSDEKLTEIKSSVSITARLVAILFFLIFLVLSISMIVLSISYVIPLLALQLFQASGIGVQFDLAQSFSSIPLKDLIVIMTMWLIPTLSTAALVVVGCCTILKKVFRRMGKWLKIIFYMRGKQNG